MADHCWHESDVFGSNTFESRAGLTCCRCGRPGTRIYRKGTTHPEGHGPYAPEIQYQTVIDETPVGPCLSVPEPARG